MKIFVITIPDSKERQTHMQNQLDKYNIEYEFFFGIDGRKLTEIEIDDLYDSKKAKAFRKELKPAEIGCSLSHKLVYKKMIDENIDRAIVLEDGITLLPDFYTTIKYLKNIKIDKVVIKLDRCNSKQTDNDNYKKKFTPWHRLQLTDNYFIGQPLNNLFLTGAYYIDIKAAGIIHSLMPKVFFMVDDWGFFRNKIKLRIINTALTYRDWKSVKTIIMSTKQDAIHKIARTNYLKKILNSLLLLFK